MRPVYSLAASHGSGASEGSYGLALLAFSHGDVASVRLLCSLATMLHDIAFEGRKLRQDSPKPLAGAL